MTAFGMLLRAQRRRVLLGLLAEAPTYESSQYVLYHALEGTHLETSSSAIALELAWLAERGLATLDQLAGATVARVTQRGLDVAKGLILIDGVARPDPGA